MFYKKPKIKPKEIKGNITTKYNNEIFIRIILLNSSIAALKITKDLKELETINYIDHTYYVLKEHKKILEILILHLGFIKDLQ